MHRSILFATLFLLAIANAYSQERENKPLPVISDEVIWSLTEATGWMKATDGQWLEGTNKLQNMRVSSLQIDQLNEGLYKIGQDNFSLLEIREITVEGRDFLILIKHQISHKYAEPTTLDDLSEPSIPFVVIEQNSGVLNAVTGAYDLPLFYAGEVKQTDHILRDITTTINKLTIQYPWISTAESTNRKFIFYYKLSDTDPTIARFFMHMDNDLANNHIFLPIPIPFVLDKKPLRDYYFELPASRIEKLAKLLIKEIQ